MLWPFLLSMSFYIYILFFSLTQAPIIIISIKRRKPFHLCMCKPILFPMYTFHKTMTKFYSLGGVLMYLSQRARKYNVVDNSLLPFFLLQFPECDQLTIITANDWHAQRLKFAILTRLCSVTTHKMWHNCISLVQLSYRHWHAPCNTRGGKHDYSFIFMLRAVDKVSPNNGFMMS